jgi:predicted acylesterase/phospholipase RssA
MADASPNHSTRHAGAIPLPETVALVLQGGGALGSYQAGVAEALDEGGIEIDWVAGISIGAVNAALIAGNPPEKRVAALRVFSTNGLRVSSRCRECRASSVRGCCRRPLLPRGVPPR